jgi:hypothetical protein
VIAGGIVAGLGYTLGVATIGTSRCGADHWLLIPAAGPFITLANEPDVYGGPCDDPEGIRHAVRMWSAIGQGVGGFLLILAAVHQRSYLVADGAGAAARANSRLTLAVIPALGPSSAGVSMLGTF